MPAERLQKLLAHAGVASRRAAEELIAAGRVTVDGRVAGVGESADPALARIELDGQPIGRTRAPVHFAVHKPAGFVSSARDERGRRSVVTLLAGAQGAAGARLWPVGRLDVASEGLMIVTDDGEWAQRVLHPRYGLEREYAVLLDRPPSPDEMVALLDGVELDDGPARLLEARPAAPPREVARDRTETGTWLRVRLGEGRKREVRRLMGAVGLRVDRLVRTRMGPAALRGLRAGAWRALTEREVRQLAGIPATGRHAREQRPAARFTIAIDGPSGSGKSTVGHGLARAVGANFVDTGLMYRALTLAALQRAIDPDDGEALGRLAVSVRVEVRRPRPDQPDRRETVLLDGRDVTGAARSPRVDRAVSGVSRHPAVRQAMLEVQRATARQDDTVMVGRDIGTVVLPKATLKVFLTASAPVRAARRAAQMGTPDRIDAYLEEIRRRDAADSGRSVAPLRKADDALVLDTGELGVDACVEAIITHLPAWARRRARATAAAGAERAEASVRA